MSITKIRKRDGKIVDFDSAKIKDAIHRAFIAVELENGERAETLTKEVVRLLEERFREKIPSVEDAQDIVIEVLNKSGYKKVAEEYENYRKKKEEIRELREKLGIVEPKLTVNALEVLNRRYLLKDETERIIETPAQMFERIAKAIANVDKIYGEDPNKSAKIFYDIMARLEFVPNSPTLFNAGTKLGQLSACFTKDQPILTSLGFKPIFAINVGDRVITHSGKSKKVTQKFVREVDEEILKISVRGLPKPTLSVTKEHPILAVKNSDITCVRNRSRICNGFPKKYCYKKMSEYRKDCKYLKKTITQPRWIPAKYLEEGDYVVISSEKEVIDKKEIKISDVIPQEDFILESDSIKAKGRPNVGKTIQNTIKIDNDFMRLIGYWLAEGSISGRKKPTVIRFSFKRDEKEFYKDALKLMRKKFNLNTKPEFAKKQSTIQLRFHSVIVAQFFKSLFGKGFAGKDIPDWMMTLPFEKQFHLMVGLFRGDGCHYNGKKQDIFYLSISNYNLAMKIWSILTRLGYHFNISSRLPKGGTKKAWRISAAPSECEDLVKAVGKDVPVKRKRFPQYGVLGNFRLRAIDKIEKIKFKGKVYNLEVKGDHSYIANGVAVHNCFVLPVEDSLESIFSAVKNMALIEKSGGGVGFDFSKLRPNGDIVRSTKGVASGPVSFMRVFDTATEVIKAGGKRRGAMMGILRVDHPDILEFITSKQKPGFLSNFNISVAVTDDFMKTLEEDGEYWLINPRNKEKVRKLKAQNVWNLMVKSAWMSGDPGVIFIDEINRHNPTPMIGRIEATNPCGEQPLLPYESCNLGSINLSRMVEDGKINWEKLKETVRNAVHFLDNVIDANKYPLKEIEAITKANRKIGLGVMGFADMLIKLGIRYDSEEALELAEKLMKFIDEEAHKKSIEIGEERGSFPNFENSIWKDKYKAIRNATVTTIAPTGSISIIAGCSSGIEPIFAISFIRNVLGGTRLFETNPLFEMTAKERGFYSGKLLEEIAKTGSVQKIDEVPEDVKKVFVTALDIKPEWHVKMQAAFQKYTDNAVSKTVNMPTDATVEDVRMVYELAWKLKCKGVTVFRYGSKPEQVLYIGEIKTRERQFVTAESEYAGGCPTKTCPFPG